MGPPNGIIGTIPCGQNITLNISANPIVVTGAEPAFDLVFYELENPANQVNLDWVIIEASINGTDTWVQIFNWGNGILDSNTNIGQLGHGSSGEPDNYPLLFADLYGGNSPGIAIDLDALAPPGIYQWVRISSPLGGGNDGAEVDAIQVLP